MRKLRKAKNLFTPNVVRGSGDGLRHVLYRRGGEPKEFGIMVSITPRGRMFPGLWQMDVCGLGCKCAAFFTPTDQKGRELLAHAAQIDSLSNIVKPVTTDIRMKLT